MTRLSAALAATALAPCRRLKPEPIAGGRLGGVARAAADLLSQAGQFGGQGGQLNAELLDILLLLLAMLDQLKKSSTNADRCGGPVRFLNPSWWRAHCMKSLPEMQPGIKLASRVQQAQCSLQTVPPSERLRSIIVKDVSSP